MPVSSEIKLKNASINSNSPSSGTAIPKEPEKKGVNITFSIASKEVIIDGEKKLLDASPYIKNNRTMVPLRLIVGDILGAEIQWDGKTKKVTVKNNDKLIELEINKQTASVNGKKILLDVFPEIKNGRTMVPIRFIAENFGFTVQWNSKTKTIMLIK